MVFNHALKFLKSRGSPLREGRSAEVSHIPRPGAVWKGEREAEGRIGKLRSRARWVSMLSTAIAHGPLRNCQLGIP